MKRLALAACLVLGTTQGSVYAVNPYPIQPTPLHHAIAQMVLGCLDKVGAEINMQPIGWWAADQLVTDDGTQAYGMYSPPTGDRVAAIVTLPKYWLHPSVLSHEMVHAFAEDGEHDHVAMQSCTIMLPGGLDSLPKLSGDSLAVIKRRYGIGFQPR